MNDGFGRQQNGFLASASDTSSGQDGTCKDSMLEQDTQKNEMEIGTENCNFTV